MTRLNRVGAVLCALVATIGGLACTSTEPLPSSAASSTEARPPAEEPTTDEPAVDAPATEEPLLTPITDLPEIDPVEEPPAPADATPEPPPQPPSAEETLEEALEAYESAQEFWREGSFDDALAALDRAYELMLSVPANGDPLIAQQRDNLRHLVSRRVIEIYASRQTVVGELDRAIPLVSNAHVEREIRQFQGAEREFFIESYRRSGRYRPQIIEALREAGMPEQLSWLPLIESGFKVRAYSRARALGLWQFIPSTGYRFGLRRDWWIDERMDPEKSTRAAIAYLTELHGLFGDWQTAIAGYNCGEHAVLRHINSQRINYFDQFWDLYQLLPHETARYVPRFLATLLIIDNPAQYGFELPEPDSPLLFDVVQVDRPVQLAALDSGLELAKGTFKDLNPELRQGATPEASYELNVPSGSGATVLATADALPKWKPPSQQIFVHRVRRGETLSHIARRYRTSVTALRRINNLRNPNRLYPGQRIKVPQRGAPMPRSVPAVASVASGTTVTYTVRRGDSLWRLAHRYATTVEQITRDNGLTSDRLSIGQELKITAGGTATTSSSSRTYVVRSGDTPGAIARAHRVRLDDLLRTNGLGRRSTIYPGQTLVIP